MIIPHALSIGRKQNLYPSVIIAQACLESNYGRSVLAANANNYFGIKWQGTEPYGSYMHKTQEWDKEKEEYYWVTDKFAKYASLAQSVEGYALRIRTRSFGSNYIYRFVWRENAPTYRDATNGLIKGGYATDPIYATKLNNLIQKYQLDTID